MRKLFKILITCYLMVWSTSKSIAQQESAAPVSLSLESKSIDELYKTASEKAFSNMELTSQILAIIAKKQEGKTEDLYNTYLIWGWDFENCSRYAEAIEKYKKAEELAQQFNKNKLAEAHIYLSIAYRKIGQYAAATSYSNQALTIALETKDEATESYAYGNLALVYSFANDFDNAIAYHLKSLALAEKQKDTSAIVICLNNITETYQTAKHYDLAFKNIEKAYYLSKNIALSTKSEMYIAYANLLNESGNWQGAIEKLNECMALFSTIESEMKANTLVTIADILLNKKKYEEAEYYLQKSVKIKDQLNNTFKAKLYFGLASLHLWKKEKKLAIQNSLSSLEISEKFQYIDISLKNHEFLYQLYKDDKQDKKALYHIERLKLLNDTLFFQEKNKKIAELQFRYDLEKSEKEVHQLRSNRNQLILYGGLALTAILLGAFLYILVIRGKNLKAVKLKNIEINEKNERLEATNELLRQFAWASAHDLKEPLRNIGSYASLFIRRYGKDTSEDGLQYLGFINNGVKRMYSLMEDLLQFIDIFSLEIPKNIEKINIEPILQNAIAHYKKLSPNAIISATGFDTIPNVPILETHAAQLLEQLISNAIKFNENEPTIEIAASLSQNNLMMSVKDNGIGIKQEFQDKIFQLFYRLDKTNPQFEGTGIGLSICKNIIEQYKGQIHFESEEGKGATFFLKIPIL